LLFLILIIFLSLQNHGLFLHYSSPSFHFFPNTIPSLHLVFSFQSIGILVLTFQILFFSFKCIEILSSEFRCPFFLFFCFRSFFIFFLLHLEPFRALFMNTWNLTVLSLSFLHHPYVIYVPIRYLSTSRTIIFPNLYTGVLIMALAHLHQISSNHHLGM
jgi:hypothetical protein